MKAKRKKELRKKAERAKVKLKRWATWTLIIVVLVFGIGVTLGILLG